MSRQRSNDPLSPDSLPLMFIKSKLKEKAQASDASDADAAVADDKKLQKTPPSVRGTRKHDSSDDLHTLELDANSKNQSLSESSFEKNQTKQSSEGDQSGKQEVNSNEDRNDNQDEEVEDKNDGDYVDNVHEQSEPHSLINADVYSSNNSVSQNNASGSMDSVESGFNCSNCYKLREKISNIKLKFEGLITTQHEWDAGIMHRKLAMLEDELENKENELEKMRHDMEILGEKLIDEIEKRAEITAANETVQGELEELTQTLFEEANTLVANEARQRHGAQVKQQALAQQLHEVNMQLQLEQAQSRELRLKVAQLEQEREENQPSLPISTFQRQSRTSLLGLSRLSASHPTNLAQKISSLFSLSPSSIENLNPDGLIDSFLFEQFSELVERGPKVKMTKIHDIPFMHHALEDDVSPCLRFGGNPRTSTKKFIDAIVANTCFIELMNEKQIRELEERDEKKKKAAMPTVEEDKSNKSTPTISIFNKTVLERITNALSSQSASERGNGMNDGDTPGCSTCGREEAYQYRFKISDVQQDVWYPICTDCRFRLLAVLDFYQFIRNLRQGLFSTRSRQDLYLEALCYKRIMFFARIGCGGMKHVDALFHLLDPVRPDSFILNSIEELQLDESIEGKARDAE